MKIAVNTRLLIKNKLDGIGWFTYHTLKTITEQHKEHKFLFIFDRKFEQEFIFNSNIEPVILSPPTRHPVLWYLWFEHRLPSFLKKQKIDFFLSPDGYLSLNTLVPSLPVIHDINFAHQPGDLPFFTEKYYNYFFPRFAKKSRRIATVSEYSKIDICKTYKIKPEKIDVVYNGASEAYKPLDAQERQIIKNEFSHSEDYFLFVGSLLPRKNVHRLLKAFDEFKIASQSKIKLLIVGSSMFKTGEILQVFNSMKFKSDVIFTGRLSAEKLYKVMGAAWALTFVPYFEGFGVPIIEAMYCDVPVITSNVTAMPEVAGDAALMINPFSVKSIVRAMQAITTDLNLRNSIIEKAKIQRQKFSWQLTSEKLWKSIEKSI